MKSFTITKKVAKHGSQAIIVVPKVIQDDLKPGTIIEVTMNVLKEAEE
jgi:hypothetical protein